MRVKLAPLLERIDSEHARERERLNDGDTASEWMSAMEKASVYIDKYLRHLPVIGCANTMHYLHSVEHIDRTDSTAPHTI